MVTGPVRPLSVMSQVTTRVLGSHVKSALPLPAVVTGGTYFTAARRHIQHFKLLFRTHLAPYLMRLTAWAALPRCSNEPCQDCPLKTGSPQTAGDGERATEQSAPAQGFTLEFLKYGAGGQIWKSRPEGGPMRSRPNSTCRNKPVASVPLNRAGATFCDAALANQRSVRPRRAA
jgi:hypothetical protein